MATKAEAKAIFENSENRTLPVHLIFKKEINTRKHSRSPKKTVTGNVILFISERTIDKFNIPVYTGEVPLQIKKESFMRTGINKTPHRCKESEMSNRGVLKMARKVKLLYGVKYDAYHGAVDYYQINFPYFFNLSMIRDSLFYMLKTNSEGTKFMCLPSQKKRDIFIGNKESISVALLGTNQLIQGLNIDEAHFGNVTIVGRPTRKKQRAR